MENWIKYVLDFYGTGGIYDMGATREEIITSTEIVYEKYGADAWGDGDSLDRERVRDILIEQFDRVFPV
jgi:hypothetical protein